MRLSPPVAPVAIQTATRLRRQLAAGSQVDASHFWREANSLALPLVTAINGADDEREVTFLWRAASPLRGVYVRLNRVTDKDNVAKGMMTQLPTTDIWHLTLRLPASYCGSYTMVEIPPETPDETVLQLGSRFASLVGKADPLNSTPGINVRGNAQESVLALDHAPAQEEWSGCRAYAGQLFTSEHRLAGQCRRVRLYLPDVPVVQPLGLLVLTDGGPPHARELRPGAEPLPLNVVDAGQPQSPAPFQRRRALMGQRTCVIRALASRTYASVRGSAGRFDGPAGQTVA